MGHLIHADESSLGGGDVNKDRTNYFGLCVFSGPSLLPYPTPDILLIGTSHF